MTYRSTLVQGPAFQGVDAEGAALIVMGANGHARWTEKLLGGVCRAVLQSMTVPVRMSH